MVKPSVIVTHAEPGASETLAALEAEGYAGIASPALVLQALDSIVPDLAGIENLVFTSANGVRYFIDAIGGMTESAAGLTAWCVGPATMAAAELAGFQKRVAGEGNAEELADLIIRKSGDAARGFLHVANSAAAGNLVARLKAAGLPARFLALYEAVPASGLTPEAHSALQDGAISFVLIHSAKGADGFRKMAAGVSLASSVIVAISEAAAAPFAATDARAIFHAARPNEDGLFKALKTAHLDL